MRSGFVTTAAGNGVDALEISNQTRQQEPRYGQTLHAPGDDLEVERRLPGRPVSAG
jgi:hypothetical protein